MKKIAHILSVFGIFLFFLFPSNKYTWMQEAEPTIKNLPTDASHEQRLIFTGMLLLCICFMQLWLLIKSAGNLEKCISLGMILCAAGVWLLRCV